MDRSIEEWVEGGETLGGEEEEETLLLTGGVIR